MDAPEIEFVHRTSLAKIEKRRNSIPSARGDTHDRRACGSRASLGSWWRRLCYSLAMTARILDGIKIRDEIFAELKTEVAQLATQGVRPGLAAVLVGENPASQMYVKSKVAACEEIGLGGGVHTPVG